MTEWVPSLSEKEKNGINRENLQVDDVALIVHWILVKMDKFALSKETNS